MTEAPNLKNKAQQVYDLSDPTRETESANPEEINPLARIAGSDADDLNWDEFIQATETSRCELDETVVSAK